jgi:hypothetical protein
MPAHVWTNAQRKAQGIRMKKLNAKKKYNKNQAKLKFPDLLRPGLNYLPQAAAADANSLNQCQTPAVDEKYIREYNYRRGLVTAMECILRELR